MGLRRYCCLQEIHFSDLNLVPAAPLLHKLAICHSCQSQSVIALLFRVCASDVSVRWRVELSVRDAMFYITVLVSVLVT